MGSEGDLAGHEARQEQVAGLAEPSIHLFENIDLVIQALGVILELTADFFWWDQDWKAVGVIPIQTRHCCKRHKGGESSADARAQWFGRFGRPSAVFASSAAVARVAVTYPRKCVSHRIHTFHTGPTLLQTPQCVGHLL